MKWNTVSQHEEIFFQEIVSEYYAQLCAFSVQYTDSFAVAEDLVQDVLLRFWEEKKYKWPKDNLRAYIFKSVRNASIDYIRKNKVLIFKTLEEGSYITEDELHEKDLQQQHEKLHRLLSELPRQEYRVLISIVVQGKKYKEVADEMELSVNTIKTHLSRAMKFMRKHNIKILTFFSFLLVFCHPFP